MPISICTSCGNKRITAGKSPIFLCEACVWRKANPPLPASKISHPPRGTAKHRMLPSPLVVYRRKDSIDYKLYLLSEEWRKKREEAFLCYGRLCLVCKAENKLHVHHKTYTNLGNELMEDLAVLCESCHDRLHTDFDAYKQKWSQRRRKRDSLLKFSNSWLKRRCKRWNLGMRWYKARHKVS